MGYLLQTRSIDQMIDGIDMSEREKRAAKAQMRRADAILDALWKVATRVGRALTRPVPTLIRGL